MSDPNELDQFIENVKASGLIDGPEFANLLAELSAQNAMPENAARFAALLVQKERLTRFQARQLLQGRVKLSVGKYRILDRIGAGAMGQVYLAEHPIMRRRVALKVLPMGKHKDEGAIERFYREARAVAALNHPNIVHAYDFDEDDGAHFFVMEYVEGKSLHEFVIEKGTVDWHHACDYIAQAALGLQHAHEAGLVHRDIKPGNLLLDTNSVVKLLDMGIALFFSEKDGQALTLSLSEQVLGTADYLAPEQALDSHNVDIRADIYSLGCTMYYLLSGHAPFPESTIPQKLLWHQSKEPTPIQELATVPDEVVGVLERMMAKNPADRFSTPGEVADALRRAAAGEMVVPPKARQGRSGPAPQRPERSAGPAASAPPPTETRRRPPTQSAAGMNSGVGSGSRSQTGMGSSARNAGTSGVIKQKTQTARAAQQVELVEEDEDEEDYEEERSSKSSSKSMVRKRTQTAASGTRLSESGATRVSKGKKKKKKQQQQTLIIGLVAAGVLVAVGAIVGIAASGGRKDSGDVVAAVAKSPAGTEGENGEAEAGPPKIEEVVPPPLQINPPPGPSPVFITEVMAASTNRIGFATCEWIEVYNDSDAPVDMSGWYIETGMRKRVRPFEEGVILPPKSVAIITHEGFNPHLFEFIWNETFPKGSLIIGMRDYLFSINDLPEDPKGADGQIFLKRADGEIADMVILGTPGGMPKMKSGHSIYLKPSGFGSLENDIGANWAVSEVGVDYSVRSIAAQNVAGGEVGSPGRIPDLPTAPAAAPPSESAAVETPVAQQAPEDATGSATP